MHLQKLHEIILPVSEGGKEVPGSDKNSEAFAEIVLCLDDRRLARLKGLGILREYYLPDGKIRIIDLLH